MVDLFGIECEKPVTHSAFIQELETDLLPVLSSIEKRGLLVDIERMVKIIEDLEEQQDLAESRAYELLGTSQRINLNSSQELVNLLSELKIEGCYFPKTKSGRLSTSKNVLERLKHPAIEHVVLFRSLTKLIASLESFFDAVEPLTSRL